MHSGRTGGVLLVAMVIATPVLARDSLGIFSGWGAFRDATPYRCYAIAQPEGEGDAPGPGYATISWWPTKSVRGQIHFRFAWPLREGSSVYLVAGGRRWRLTSGARDAWSPSSKHDAFILARLRAAGAMRITGVDRKRGNFADVYDLEGAASAFDAAALGCAKSG